MAYLDQLAYPDQRGRRAKPVLACKEQPGLALPGRRESLGLLVRKALLACPVPQDRRVQAVEVEAALST